MIINKLKTVNNNELNFFIQNAFWTKIYQNATVKYSLPKFHNTDRLINAGKKPHIKAITCFKNQLILIKKFKCTYEMLAKII